MKTSYSCESAELCSILEQNFEEKNQQSKVKVDIHVDFSSMQSQKH